MKAVDWFDKSMTCHLIFTTEHVMSSMFQESDAVLPCDNSVKLSLSQSSVRQKICPNSCPMISDSSYEKLKVMYFYVFRIRRENTQMRCKRVTSTMVKRLKMSQNCHFIHIQMEDWQTTTGIHLSSVHCHHSTITRY